MCKSWCELILGVLIIIFALWQTAYSQWIIIILAAVLIIHSFTCKKCFNRMGMNKEMMVKTSRRKKR